MLNIILFGPPNCGKGTQAALLKEKFNLIHLSTGDLLRGEVKEGTDLGKMAKEIMDRGDLVPDDIILGMINNKLDANADAAGFLLTVFPAPSHRQTAWGICLEKHGAKVDAVISLLVPEDELRTRVTKRAAEQGRADDKIEVFENRMQNYKDQTLPLADYYKAKGLLREVDGVGTIDEVFARAAGQIS